MDETKKQFEENLTDEENAAWTQAKALIEIAYQLKRLADKQAGKEINPYAMEGCGVELEGPARL